MEHAHRGSPVLMSRSELFRSYEDVRPQGFQQFAERVRTQRRAHQHDAHRRHDRMAQFGHDAGISGGFCTRRAPGEGHGRSDVRRQERPAASVRRRDVRLRRKGAGHQIQRRGERREGDFQRRPAPRQGSGLQPDGPQRPDYDGAEPDGPSGKRKVAASRAGERRQTALDGRHPLHNGNDVRGGHGQVRTLLRHQRGNSARRPAPDRVPAMQAPHQRRDRPRPRGAAARGRFQVRTRYYDQYALYQITNEVRTQQPDAYEKVTENPFLPYQVLIKKENL